MHNIQRGVKTTEQNCKVKKTIEVDSEKFNADKAYSKPIKPIKDQLAYIFEYDINPTK